MEDTNINKKELIAGEADNNLHNIENNPENVIVQDEALLEVSESQEEFKDDSVIAEEQDIIENVSEPLVEKDILDELSLTTETPDSELDIESKNNAEVDATEVSEDISEISQEQHAQPTEHTESIPDAAIETNHKETNEEKDFVTKEDIQECKDIHVLLDLAEKVVEDNDYQRLKETFISVRDAFEGLLAEAELSTSQNDIEEKSEETALVTNLDTTESVQERFAKIKAAFSKRKKEHLAQQEAEKLQNLSKKQQILEELKELIDSEETIQQTWEDFKQLQNKWKEIGQVPLKDNVDLWNNFNFLVDRFLDKVKINKELRDLDYKKNQEAKIELCEKIEELLLEESIDDAVRKLREYQSAWRETGSVTYEKRDEINERFQRAIEKFNEKRKAFYESIKIELHNNLEVKKALVKKALEINENEIQNIKDWNDFTAQIDELFKLWKSAGHVPKKDNEVVWGAFRSEMNTFFNRKKAFFTKMKDEQLENYNKKLLLCKQAEAIQESTDWKQTTDELIKLQNEWKTIGIVPKRYSETLWKRFRMACDMFFKRKQEYFANIDNIEESNLQAKKNLIEQMKHFEFSSDKTECMTAIKDFQRKFIEIGRVPLKQKDAIQKEFSQAVENLMDKLQISKTEKHVLNFKAKYEHVAGTESGRNNMKKEVFHISNNIQKLESDIQLWENNIGFFAKSKNADILTAEFKEKIEHAKTELIIQKEKLRALQKISR